MKRTLFIFILSSIFIGCLLKHNQNQQTIKIKKYKVKKIENGTIFLDGIQNEIAWQKAKALREWASPWSTDIPQNTVFKALFDEVYFYFYFLAEDETIHIEHKKKADMLNAVRSDRVELFFKLDDDMNPYYIFEMDPLGRTFAAKGKFYRQFDEHWILEKNALQIKANYTDNAYAIEGKFRLDSLRAWGLLKNKQLQTGIFRADYFPQQNGVSVHWLSWVIPNSKIADFHISSAFGVLLFE